MRKSLLRLGAIIFFIIAIGHFICLWYMDKVFETYGVGYIYERMLGIGPLVPSIVTFGLVVLFTVAGLYGLSAAGDIKLPCTRLAIKIIVILFLIRLSHGICIILFADEFTMEYSNIVLIVSILFCYLQGWKPLK